MNEELTWLSKNEIASMLKKHDEDKLRDIINWLDEQPYKIKEKVKPIIDMELNRRAIQAYESMNGGEWI